MRATVRFVGAAILIAVPSILLAQSIDTTVYSSLRWREIGPFRGGRSVAVAGSVARPNEYYMGTTGGGVFKSIDGGESWAPVTDKYFGGTIGAIAVARVESRRRVRGRRRVPDSRQRLARRRRLEDHRRRQDLDVARPRSKRGRSREIRVHPRESRTSSTSAALGHVWGPTPERGIYRSNDGGKTWKKILFRNDSTGAVDLVDGSARTRTCSTPRSGRRAARRGMLVTRRRGQRDLQDHRRRRQLDRDHPQSRHCRPGLIGNIGISVSAANPGLVCAIIEADSGGVFRSDERRRHVDAHQRRPQAPAARLVLHRDLRRHARTRTSSTSTTCRSRNRWTAERPSDPTRPHGDSHDFWIAPDDNKRMIEANDGGANVSRDGGRTWTDEDYLHGAVLSRHHHQSLPVPDLRRAAGQQHAVRQQPRRYGRRPGERRRQCALV